ncbi:MAG: transcription-repair coupling factor [Firmicutes bacterium]|nr:transcription-repair coupling factor [Bacillota bacterium]
MLPKHLSLNSLGGEFTELKTAITRGEKTAVFSAIGNARYHISAGLEKFFLLVTSDSVSARKAQEILKGYCEKEVVYIPEGGGVRLKGKPIKSLSDTERFSALTKILTGGASGAVVSAEALLQYLPSAEHFSSLIVSLNKNQTINRDKLISLFINAGYKRESAVQETGDFSVKGEIVDIWALGEDLPVRLEFFDDIVESVRYFAPESMTGVKEISEITISPIALSTANAPQCTLFDYLNKSAVIALDETVQIYEKIKAFYLSHITRIKNLTEAGEEIDYELSLVPTPDKIAGDIRDYAVLGFQNITSGNLFYKPSKIFSIKALPVTRYAINRDALVRDIKNALILGGRVIIFAGNLGGANALYNFFLENDLKAVLSETGGEDGEFLIVKKYISGGFIYPQNKITVIGTDDIIRREAPKAKSLKEKRGAFITPVKGDFVVHETHGIGISEGVVQIESGGNLRDYYVIKYKGEDRLYIPVDQLDTVEKYTGGGKPEIHAIGGKEFARIKERVKKSVKALAVDLLSLYEKRLSGRGYKYQQDTVWQKELEDSFEFNETEDQLRAIAEIKSDMESGKVMDRLLAGDVGFGKTEVAIRAIFKTVIEGRQSAILSPTTILTQQHYNTLKKRFGDFGIKIDVLSRFMSKNYISSALERIKSGETSVIVATHRLLSKDVSFKDLGLLVLDEEQRFGVEHKEKIKALKTNVNVLALSATPIPRTLHMALSGIRDISVLETPPVNRQPIETFVCEYSEALVKDAVLRELSRGGQVFVLYNRVQTIENFYNRLRDFLPSEAKIIYAHGQLESGELEDRILKFYNKEANVLISTTIIENGIDLPSANTLIVVDSDSLGLSELYQLRGRVGRSDALAYAYFTVREGKVLTENAGKRLDALLSHTELGSGFKIAMQDLEIRGAGNVLGREQHGNMEKVGYDLYVKLLNESMDELNNTSARKRREAEILVDGDVSLPNNYIENAGERVRFYKKTASLTSQDELSEFLITLKDAYGEPSESVLALLAVGLIKNLAMEIDIKRVIAKKDALSLIFYDFSVLKNESVMNALSKFQKTAVLTPLNPPSILFENKTNSLKARLETLLNFLLACN